MADSVAGQSRFAVVQLQVPVDVAEAEDYVIWVGEVCRRWGVDHLFWTTTNSTLALDEFRHLLGDSLLSDLPPSEIIDKAYDKVKTACIARQAGVPVPATWAFADTGRLRAAISQLPERCVIKPRYSSVVRGTKIVNCGGHAFSQDGPSLLVAHDAVLARGAAPMVQEYIPGYGFGLFLLMYRGEPVAAFSHRRVREADPFGSGSSFRISTRMPDDAYEHSVQLLKAMAWHGVAMVEFRRDSRDGTAKMIEVNGRFWFSLSLAVCAGVDFPALLLKVKAGEEIHGGLPAYREGVGCHWIGGEARHLYKVMKGKPAGYPGEYPRRLRTILRMAADFIVHPRCDSLQSDDLRPALCEIRLLLKGIV